MTATGVLGTSAVIALPRLQSTAGLPEHSVTTTVTLAELAVGPLVADDVQERARRQAVLQQAEADLQALPFDLAAGRAFGRVAADLRGAGRKPAARSYDAMIAAIALSRRLPVHTANPVDFALIDGLVVVAIPAHVSAALGEDVEVGCSARRRGR